LIDRQELALRLRPALRNEVPGEGDDLAEILLCLMNTAAVARWKMPVREIR
jgi:hypothetical protein